VTFTQQRATELWESNDLISLGREADALRRQIHPEGIVTYTEVADEVFELRFPRAAGIEERLNILFPLRQQDLMVVRPTVDATATGVEYLKSVALTRLCLDNVPHIQASWRLFGLKVAQLALRFGADDLGRADVTAPEEELRRLIREAGFIPKHRDALFRSYSIA
jgi:2-iminoacetate synthase ThiH